MVPYGAYLLCEPSVPPHHLLGWPETLRWTAQFRCCVPRELRSPSQLHPNNWVSARPTGFQHVPRSKPLESGDQRIGMCRHASGRRENPRISLIMLRSLVRFQLAPPIVGSSEIWRGLRPHRTMIEPSTRQSACRRRQRSDTVVLEVAGTPKQRFGFQRGAPLFST